MERAGEKKSKVKRGKECKDSKKKGRKKLRKWKRESRRRERAREQKRDIKVYMMKRRRKLKDGKEK